MATNFSNISKISPTSLESWQNRVFLTFDIDWAHDDILLDTIDLVEESNVCATWFVTHETPVLERLRKNPKFELGVHPNFNFLFNADSHNGRTAEEVLDRVVKLVPGATSVRSHCMTQSSTFFDLFRDAGLTHDVNHFIPAHLGIELKPWLLWNGLYRVPYCWEDDVHILYDRLNERQNSPAEIAHASSRFGLKVFDFHPIHIYLNTNTFSHYEDTRKIHRSPLELVKYRHQGHGTRDRLIQLLKEA